MLDDRSVPRQLDDEALDVAASALAALLGETDAEAIANLRQIVAERGLAETRRLYRQLRFVLFRSDGTRRTVGGSFFALVERHTRPKKSAAPTAPSKVERAIDAPLPGQLAIPAAGVRDVPPRPRPTTRTIGKGVVVEMKRRRS